MLMRGPTVENSFYRDGSTNAPGARHHAGAAKAANTIHDTTDMFTGENADAQREARFVNGAVVLIMSCFAGFCSAIFAALLGSSVLTAFLIYVGFSCSGLLLLLAFSCFRSNANEADEEHYLEEDLIECDVTNAESTIFSDNRRMRFRYYLAVTAVLSTLMVSDHWAVVSGVGLCSVLAVLWSSIARQRAMMMNTAESRK